jgi:hypothetical protein
MRVQSNTAKTEQDSNKILCSPASPTANVTFNTKGLGGRFGMLHEYDTPYC